MQQYSASIAVITIGVTYIPSHPPYYICPITILSGLYATTLLAVLNSRLNLSTVPHVEWRVNAQTDHSRSFNMREMTGSSTSSFVPNRSSIRDAHCHGVVVTVTKEELVGNDSEYVTNDQKVSCSRKLNGDIIINQIRYDTLLRRALKPKHITT